MGEDAVELGEQGPQPDRTDRDLHPEHRLDPEDDPELGGERGQPVVPVGQDGDLPVVADLEQLLGATVHVADDRLGRDDPLAVEDDLQAQDAVRGRVLGADVEDHVGRGETARPDRDVERARLGGGVGGHPTSVPHPRLAGQERPTRRSTQWNAPNPSGAVSAVTADERATAAR